MDITTFANLLLAIVLIAVYSFLFIIIVISYAGSYIESRKFMKAASKSLEFESLKACINGIRNDYEVYKGHRFGNKRKTIIQLCQELERSLKLKKNENNQEAKKQNEKLVKLEDIILIYKDDYQFNDEKMNSVIASVEEKNGTQDARALREYLIRLNAYHSGILFEKDQNFSNMQDKLKRKKFWSNFGFIIGIIGSILSIYSAFIK